MNLRIRLKKILKLDIRAKNQTWKSEHWGLNIKCHKIKGQLIFFNGQHVM
jgi:hypothetical protein